MFPRLLSDPIDAGRFASLATDLARDNHISSTELKSVAWRGLETLTDHALSDNLMTTEEEERIIEIAAALNITKEELAAQSVGGRIIKGAILRDLDEGKTPKRIDVDGSLPINLRRGESVIWIFNNVIYSSVRTRTRIEGRSQGVSFRIAKGVYYRFGASRGTPIKTEHLTEEGRGALIITDRGVAFVGGGKAVRIPANKILTVTPYSDGVGILRDAATARPQVFELDDPWFATNMIARLNQIA